MATAYSWDSAGYVVLSGGKLRPSSWGPIFILPTTHAFNWRGTNLGTYKRSQFYTWYPCVSSDIECFLVFFRLNSCKWTITERGCLYFSILELLSMDERSDHMALNIVWQFPELTALRRSWTQPKRSLVFQCSAASLWSIGASRGYRKCEGCLICTLKCLLASYPGSYRAWWQLSAHACNYYQESTWAWCDLMEKVSSVMQNSIHNKNADLYLTKLF